MEPAVLGGKPASGLVGRMVRRPFRPDGPGAGLVHKPVRLSALVSFRGEQRTLGEKEVRGPHGHGLPGRPPFPAHGLDRLAPLPLVDLFTDPVCGNRV
jgi:hypothetical protein